MFEYNANTFDALDELEAIRVNVPMYAGSSGAKGILKLFGEVIENAKDEAEPCYLLYKEGKRSKPTINVNIEMLPDGSVIVEDDARGIPVDVNSKTGLPAVYMAFEKKHAGGKLKNLKNSGYISSIGVHGIGLTLVNACSKYVDITIKRGGKVYSVKYENGGSKREDLKEIGKCDVNETGTRIHFLYDDEVLQPIDDELGRLEYPFIIEEVKEVLTDLVMFTEHLTIHFKWNTGKESGEETYSNENYNPYIYIEKYSNNNPIFVYNSENEEEKYKMRMYFSFTEPYEDTLKLSVVNGLKMTLGSSFQRAFEEETFKYFEHILISNRKIQNGYELSRNEVINKLNYIIILETDVRDFANQAKNSYSNDRITIALRDDFKVALSRIEQSEIARITDSIVYEYNEKIKQVKRYEAEKEKKLPRKNKRDMQEVMSKKFKDCLNGKNMKHKNRVWFLEGDSAGNGFAAGRDATFEAYAMLRGKPLNVMRNSISRVRYDSKGKKETIDYEQFTLIRSIVETGKFSSYIICTDADVDGRHIRNLVSYIFFKFFPEIILRGQLYIAEAPLYKMVKGKEVKYAFYEDERMFLEREGFKVDRRYKGLGEMEKGELYKVLTTENKFIQLSLDDVKYPLDIDSDYLDDDFKEAITSENIVKYIAGKDTFLRKEISKEFMSEKLISYLQHENMIRKQFVSKINPLFLHSDKTPLTQDEINVLMDLKEAELDIRVKVEDLELE